MGFGRSRTGFREIRFSTISVHNLVYDDSVFALITCGDNFGREQ